jgi:hypothetical protein
MVSSTPNDEIMPSLDCKIIIINLCVATPDHEETGYNQVLLGIKLK